MSDNKIFNFGKIDRYVFLGGSSQMTQVLEHLAGNAQVFVFTAKRLLGEPSHVLQESFESYLQRKGITYFVSDNINEDENLNKLLTPSTLGISISGPWIIRGKTLAAFGGKIINGHGQNLPKNRGGGGFSWNILQGLRTGYLTYHFVTEGIDDGDILYSSETSFPASARTPQDFESIHRKKMADACLEILQKIAAGEDFHLISQNNEESSYWPRLNTDLHGFINWDWQAVEIANFIHAFSHPWKGAQTFLDTNGKKLRLKSAIVAHQDGDFHPFQIGIIYRITEKQIYIAASGGSLVVDEIVDDAGNPCLRKISVGSRLFTPRDLLDKALSTRVRYGAEGLL